MSKLVGLQQNEKSLEVLLLLHGPRHQQVVQHRQQRNKDLRAALARKNDALVVPAYSRAEWEEGWGGSCF